MRQQYQTLMDTQDINKGHYGRAVLHRASDPVRTTAASGLGAEGQGLA